MSYAVQGRFLSMLTAAPVPSRSPAPAAVDGGGAQRRWRSRREVVDWLSSLVSGHNHGSPSMAARTTNNAADSQKVHSKGTKAEPRSDSWQERKHDAVEGNTDQHKVLYSGVSGSGCSLSSLFPSCHVEVLCQDSGIRGCWFRCKILKMRGDKMKVVYKDLQNADDTGLLEEWITQVRIANPDDLGIRLLGRPLVRPEREEDRKGSIFCFGAIVDAWLHSGWWEGIVLGQGDGGRLQVYFPGEKRMAEFSEDELRQSLEWVGGKWYPLKERVDVASKLAHTVDFKGKCLKVKHISQKDGPSQKPELEIDGQISHDQECSLADLTKGLEINDPKTNDLTDDLKSNDLKWSARRRRRSKTKRQSDASSGVSSLGYETSSPGESFLPDGDLCKSSGGQCSIGTPVQDSNQVK